MTANEVLIAKAAGVTTLNQLEILLVLFDAGPMTMGNAAKRLGLTTAAVTGIADAMENQDLIYRSKGDDRRVIQIYLTRAGLSLAANLLPTSPAA